MRELRRERHEIHFFREWESDLAESLQSMALSSPFSITPESSRLTLQAISKGAGEMKLQQPKESFRLPNKL